MHAAKRVMVIEYVVFCEGDYLPAREDAPQRIRQVVIAMQTRRSTPDRRIRACYKTHTMRTRTRDPGPKTGRLVPKTGASGPKSGLGDRFLSVENGPRPADLRTKPLNLGTKGRVFGARVCVFAAGAVCIRGAAGRKPRVTAFRLIRTRPPDTHRCQMFPGRL